jgi:hypothetical protein
MRVRITLEGTTSLLCHNARLANPLDPLVRQMKAISSKRKKTDDDLERLARLEFEGGLYFDDSGPHVPGANIEKSIVEGARITRQGKQVERGLFITDDEVPLIYSGPRGVDELWADESRRSMMSVKVGTNRVMRCRPMFRTWKLEAHGEMDPAQLNLDVLEGIVTDAGAMVGLGDYRPRYGRYTATVDVVDGS